MTNNSQPNNLSSPKSNSNNNIVNGSNSPVGQVQNVEMTSPNTDNLIKSKTHVIKNNYWNERHENILKGLQMNSNKLYKEYQKAHLVYKKKLRLYRIPIIIMSSLSGFLSISNSGYIPATYNKWVSMFVGFVNLMVTVISLIENFKKIDVNMNKTYSAYQDFKKLHDEISMILNTPQNEREDNGYDMANAFFSRYEMYLNDAPILGKALHDYLDLNSPDNTTQSINPSDSYSKSPDNTSISTSISNEELYTEAEIDVADELEAQRRAGFKKFKKTENFVKNTVNKSISQTKGKSPFLNFLSFGSSDEVQEVDSLRDNLNAIKANVRNSGRTKPIDSDSLNKNVFVKKKQQAQKKAIETIKKANKMAEQAKKKVETDVENEINSNMNRLEEEIKKLDDLELKPTNIPVLRNIKISEDNDNLSLSQTKSVGKNDPDYIEIVGDIESDSDSEN